jgi:hypothetical protein
VQNKQTEETCASDRGTKEKVDPVAWKFRKVSERLTRFGAAIIFFVMKLVYRRLASSSDVTILTRVSLALSLAKQVSSFT